MKGSGLSVALPLSVSDVFGPYDLNTTFPALAQQNLKMLILTIPGERIMYPEFGVGLRKYLFENNTPDTDSEIKGNIAQQVSIYLPYISLDNIIFRVPENNPDLFPNTMSVAIFFTITPIQEKTLLEININN